MIEYADFLKGMVLTGHAKHGSGGMSIKAIRLQNQIKLESTSQDLAPDLQSAFDKAVILLKDYESNLVSDENFDRALQLLQKYFDVYVRQ